MTKTLLNAPTKSIVHLVNILSPQHQDRRPGTRAGWIRMMVPQQGTDGASSTSKESLKVEKTLEYLITQNL